MALSNDLMGLPWQGLRGGAGDPSDLGQSLGPWASQHPSAASTPTNSNPFASLLPTPGQLGGFTPLPYTAFGQVPYVDPTYMQSAGVNMSELPGAMDTFKGELLTSLAPQFAQQQQSLDAGLAGRGIFNSGAGAQAQNDLLGQQLGAVANPLGALTQQFAGYWNQDQLANAANQQQANQYNAGVANTTAAGNAQAYGNAVNQYGQDYNAFLANLLGQGTNLSTGLLGTLLGSYQPNNAATGILEAGTSNAGSAYSNAYNAGLQSGGLFGNALTTALGQLGNHSTTPPAGSQTSTGTGIP